MQKVNPDFNLNEGYYDNEALQWIKNNVDLNSPRLIQTTRLNPTIIKPNNTNRNFNYSIPLLVEKTTGFILDGNHRYFNAIENNVDKLLVIFIPEIPQHLNSLVIKELAKMIYNKFK